MITGSGEVFQIHDIVNSLTYVLGFLLKSTHLCDEPKKIVNHWIKTSNDDFEAMLTLYNSKSYGWSLFLGHISTEKLFKALYVKRFAKHAPYTHNLYRLAELLELEFSDEYADWLDGITSFNINARYNDFKQEFYSICTPGYTESWIKKIRIIRTWIKKML